MESVLAGIGGNVVVLESIEARSTGRRKDFAGKGIANPTALMLSSALMLIHLGEISAATRLRSAIEQVYAKQDSLPPDVGGSASTNKFTDAVIAHLG